ncbi:disease resistance protein (TIR-NBS-LRR class), partial [Trifolium pratense]
RNECEYIKDIVDKVSRLLNKTDLFIANNPVGIESRVQDMIQLLNPQSNRVLLLGMWGMGGIGKTTIAKAIYNKIGRNFESRSFLEDIREVGETLAGQVSLQKQLLCDVYKERTIKIANIDSGKILLKDILSCREVFIVLDDVSTLDQLNILCGSREWFGSGSIIIITTRDLHLLRGRVDKIYEMTIMNEHESLELFSWNAFKQASPKGDFVRISKDVVEYSKGLPLALEVLGSYLFNRTESQWELVLEKLRRIPNVKVQNKLRISYDGLDDDDQQEIFLDIACFLIGMDRDDVILILNDCGLSAEIGISVLVERSLVTIDYRNRLGMHDLLRDMGREIIREESPRRPEERSRLWFHEDVIDVLSKQNGKGNVTGLALKLPRGNAKCFRTKAFENMERLRLLQLDEVKLDGDFEYVSRDLRWLSWNRLSHLPTNFYRENLVSLELEHCNFELVWKKTLRMEKLKILNLSHSHRLTQSPDFSNMPNLEKLVLKDCRKLSEIDKLEEDLEQMESLTALIANNTAITRVPFSVVKSKSIGYISLCGYEGFARDVFPSIVLSWMSPTNNLTSPYQTYAPMSSLVSLDLPNSSSHDLSSFSNQLPRLRSLWVNCNSEDQLIVDAEIILDALYATISKELESTATTSQVSNMTTSTFIRCCSQVNVSESKHSLKSLLIQMGMNCQVSSILKEKILQNMDINGSGGYLLPGDSYPDWLTFSSEGSFVTFRVPQVKGRNLKTMICIVDTSTPDNITSDGLRNILVKNYTKATIQLYKREALVSFEDEEGQRVVSSMESGNIVEVVVVFENNFTVKNTVVYLVYDEPSVKRFSTENEP